MTRPVICTRCQQTRHTRNPEPYVCQRRREVLRGSRFVIDPKVDEVSPEVRAARSATGRRARAIRTALSRTRPPR